MRKLTLRKIGTFITLSVSARVFPIHSVNAAGAVQFFVENDIASISLTLIILPTASRKREDPELFRSTKVMDPVPFIEHFQVISPPRYEMKSPPPYEM